MATAKSAQAKPITAVQSIYDALEPLDEEARNRVLQSVTSLLGMSTAGWSPGPGGSAGKERTPSPKADRPISLQELIQEKKPVTNAQYIALFAFCREKSENLPRFSRSDLEGYFSKAKLPPPGNYDRDFNKAVQLGWIHEDGSDSYLTTRGVEAVEAGFEGKQPPRGNSARRRGRIKVKAGSR